MPASFYSRQSEALPIFKLHVDDGFGCLNCRRVDSMATSLYSGSMAPASGTVSIADGSDNDPRRDAELVKIYHLDPH